MSLMRMDLTGRFFRRFTRATAFQEFRFAFLTTKPLPKKVIAEMKEYVLHWEQIIYFLSFFRLEYIPFEKGGGNFERVASHVNVSIILNRPFLFDTSFISVLD